MRLNIPGLCANCACNSVRPLTVTLCLRALPGMREQSSSLSAETDKLKRTPLNNSGCEIFPATVKCGFKCGLLII